jgi:hypothetical protein
MTTETALLTALATLASTIAFLFNALRSSEKASREAAVMRAERAEAELSKTTATLLAVLERQREKPSARP